MTIGKQVLFCAAVMVVIRFFVQILPPHYTSTADAIWVVLNQWLALGYFWVINRQFSNKGAA